MVMVWVPVVARVVVLRVRVEVPAPVMEVGLKLAVTPEGSPLADKLIAELNPPVTALVIWEVPELPLTTVTEVGEVLQAKASRHSRHRQTNRGRLSCASARPGNGNRVRPGSGGRAHRQGQDGGAAGS